jgi:hypothetical protein
MSEEKEGLNAMDFDFLDLGKKDRKGQKKKESGATRSRTGAC